MALRFGNTTRLHHIDFPAASTESGSQTWEQTIPKTQSEIKPASQGTHKTGKVNVRIRKRQEKESSRKARQDRSTQSLSSAELKSEILNNSGSCGFSQEVIPNRATFSAAITQQSAAMCYMNLTVEWDVLDSFSEFATFLELQNPICPAHLIDTPEKLISVLSCEL
ncbi:hypothetical protein OS493_017251 [Desmophyllum pertusum]|uniref:Uncharacterized protein n=1 Tax=Desmophyllum pertusum TaxID=174260 RepID=A0A9X0D9K3_9CNID|nr:hypothetical protein OS493_017251 [Desmophyllum pertusum]